VEKIIEEFLSVRPGMISNDVDFSEFQASPAGKV